jgi:hypothetical protein
MGVDIAGIDNLNRPQFLAMIAQPDLAADFPEQYEKHWQDQGVSGTARILTFQILEHPCELTFNLFFSGEEVRQTGIIVKFRDETMLNVVRKGDALDYNRTKRIDPIAFLRQTFLAPSDTPADDLPPPASVSFALTIDDDSEPQVFRAVQQLTGRGESELRAIWGELIATNGKRSSREQVSPIITTWLKKERDRIDLDYLRFAQLLRPRDRQVVHFSAPGHTCVVVTRQMPGSHIRERVDGAEPEWWGGQFYARRQAAGGRLVAVPHEQKDRLLALKRFEPSLEFPVEEIFIDNRQIYAVMFVGEEALVWRTARQPAPEAPGMTSKAVASRPLANHPLLDPSRSAFEPPPEIPEEPPPPEGVHPFVLARAEKLYMDALAAKSSLLKEARKEYMRQLFASDPARFDNRAEEFRREIMEAAGKALRRDLAGIQREAALVDAHVTIFYAERE